MTKKKQTPVIRREFLGLTLREWLERSLAYFLLTLFAFLMIFPFLYMMFTSLKTSNDVFVYPPRLLPYTDRTTTYDGQERSLYRIEVDGEERLMVPTDEIVRMGFFTTADQINLDNPENSPVVAAVPLDEAERTDQEITRTLANGDEEDFDIYTVPVEGDMRELVLVDRRGLNVFVDPDNPEVTTRAVQRTADPAEYVEFQIENYDAVFNLRNLNRALVNTTLVTVAVVVGQLVTSIFGGYAFSRMQFRGRDTLFLVYLGSIMVPFVVLIIPMYRLMVVLGWQNQLVSLIVPWIFTAYGTFLMRQFFLSIPQEIEEAALLDGASRFRILWQIFVPLSKPGIATLAIFSFLYAWNSFLWPLLIIGQGNEMNHVLTLALIRLSNAAADKPNIVMTGAAIAILPPMIVFIFAQRYFIQGVATSGLKG